MNNLKQKDLLEQLTRNLSKPNDLVAGRDMFRHHRLRLVDTMTIKDFRLKSTGKEMTSPIKAVRGRYQYASELLNIEKGHFPYIEKLLLKNKEKSKGSAVDVARLFAKIRTRESASKFKEKSRLKPVNIEEGALY